MNLSSQQGENVKLISFMISFSFISLSLITGCTTCNQGKDNSPELYPINYNQGTGAFICSSDTQGISQKSFIDHLVPNRGVIGMPCIPHGN
jgi:hypothetical protein